jgi:deazaflavin-dependent oxidoreductase (nitroreductase family)
VKLSRGFARFNRVVTNRVQGLWAPTLAPWAVFHHVGRRSGRAYQTPVMAFVSGQYLVVALLYGQESDWLRNLSATPGQVVRRRRTYSLVGAPRISPTEETPELDGLSPFGRAYCRLATHQAVFELGRRIDGP